MLSSLPIPGPDSGLPVIGSSLTAGGGAGAAALAAGAPPAAFLRDDDAAPFSPCKTAAPASSLAKDVSGG